MKNKKLLISLMIITSSIMIGCTSKISSEEKVINSVVIDEEAKETANSNNKIIITKVATTENLIDRKVSMLRSDEKLIEIKYKIPEESSDISRVQFEKIYISGLSIGTITDEIKDNRNMINWKNKEVDGQLLIDYMGMSRQIKILNNDKVYELDENYNLKEDTIYKKLIEDTNADINRFQPSYDENLEIYFTDNNDKIKIIDTLNDDYYEIDSKLLDSFKNRQQNIIMAEDNKIYFSLPDIANKEESILGYIENNKLTTFFDEESEIKVRVTGDVIYSKINILFSGYVEDDYGVWNYNIETKKLEKQLQLKYDYSYFKVSKDKKFIIISNKDNVFTENYNISLARIDEDLKISNIQELTNSILPKIDNNKWLHVTGWSKSSNKFYVYNTHSKNVDSGLEVDDVYYEVYEVK